MTSGMTHDSGIHTMSSRRDSAMSDTRNYEFNKFGKSNSDCLPVTQNFSKGISTHSLDKLVNQMEYIANFNSNNGVREPISVFQQPRESLYDLKTSLDAGNKFYQCDDPGGGRSLSNYQQSREHSNIRKSTHEYLQGNIPFYLFGFHPSLLVYFQLL